MRGSGRAHARRRGSRVRAFDSNRSTARDDAPNADKQNFYEGGSGDRAAFVPFV